MKKCTTTLTLLALLACQPAHAGRITFAGTILQRHLLPKNLRSAVKQAVEKAAQAGNLQGDSPRHVPQNQRRVRNVEQQHYGVSARASQRRSRSGG